MKALDLFRGCCSLLMVAVSILSTSALAQSPCAKWLESSYDFLLPPTAFTQPVHYTEQETLFFLGIQNHPRLNPANFAEDEKAWRQADRLGQRLRLEAYAQKLSDALRLVRRTCTEESFYKFYGDFFKTYRDHLRSLQRWLNRPLREFLAADFALLDTSIDVDNLAVNYQSITATLRDKATKFWQALPPTKALKNYSADDFYAAASVQVYNRFIKALAQLWAGRSLPHQLSLAAFSAYGPLYALKIDLPIGQDFIPLTSGETALGEVIRTTQKILEGKKVDVHFYFSFQENFQNLVYYQQQGLPPPHAMIAQIENSLLEAGRIQVNLPLALLADPLVGIAQMHHEQKHLQNFVSIIHPKGPTTYPIFVRPPAGQVFFPHHPGFYNEGLSLDEAAAYAVQAKFLADWQARAPLFTTSLPPHTSAALAAGRATQQEALRLIDLILAGLKNARYDLDLQEYPLWPQQFKVDVTIYGEDARPQLTLSVPLVKKQFAKLSEVRFWRPLTAYLTRQTDELPQVVIDRIVQALIKTTQNQQHRLQKINFSENE